MAFSVVCGFFILVFVIVAGFLIAVAANRATSGKVDKAAASLILSFFALLGAVFFAIALINSLNMYPYKVFYKAPTAQAKILIV